MQHTHICMTWVQWCHPWWNECLLPLGHSDSHPVLLTVWTSPPTFPARRHTYTHTTHSHHISKYLIFLLREPAPELHAIYIMMLYSWTKTCSRHTLSLYLTFFILSLSRQFIFYYFLVWPLSAMVFLGEAVKHIVSPESGCQGFSERRGLCLPIRGAAGMPGCQGNNV